MCVASVPSRFQHAANVRCLLSSVCIGVVTNRTISVSQSLNISWSMVNTADSSEYSHTMSCSQHPAWFNEGASTYMAEGLNGTFGFDLD